MTNKEALQFIIDTFNQKPDDIGLFFKFCDAHKQLKESLEILDILKKRLNIKIPYGSVNVISACNGDDYLPFEVELEEHTKIEEWLENDK